MKYVIQYLPDDSGYGTVGTVAPTTQRRNIATVLAVAPVHNAITASPPLVAVPSTANYSIILDVTCATVRVASTAPAALVSAPSAIKHGPPDQREPTTQPRLRELRNV